MEESRARKVQVIFMVSERPETLPWLCRVMNTSRTSSSTKKITADAGRMNNNIQPGQVILANSAAAY